MYPGFAIDAAESKEGMTVLHVICSMVNFLYIHFLCYWRKNVGIFISRDALSNTPIKREKN